MNALVVGLHGLANLVVRSLEFDSDLESAELKSLRVKAADFSPGSAKKSAWISLNAATVTSLTEAAVTRSAASVALVSALDDICSDPAIASLLDLRNTHYHRWRGESDGVTGIAYGAVSAAELFTQCNVVSFGPELLEPYLDGRAALDDLVLVSRVALDALILHMEPFLVSWFETLPTASL